jgi:hypothetical protein
MFPSAGVGRLERKQWRSLARCRLSWDSRHMESPGARAWRVSNRQYFLVLFWEYISRLPEAGS